jgi:hypothetical protein
MMTDGVPAARTTPASAPTLEEVESADIENALVASSSSSVVVDSRIEEDDEQLLHETHGSTTASSTTVIISESSSSNNHPIRHDDENNHITVPFPLPSAPPQQQDDDVIIITSASWQPTSHEEEEEEARPENSTIMVPLYVELFRRLREVKGCGWIWTLALIAASIALCLVPEYEEYCEECEIVRLWVGVATCILVTTFSSYLWIGLVEINLERVQKSSGMQRLGGVPFDEVLFLGTRDSYPLLCRQGELRNWQWPYALTLCGSLFFAALFSGPRYYRTNFPGVAVALWTLHFMVGIVTPLLVNTSVFRPARPVTCRYIWRVVLCWISLPVGMFLLFSNAFIISGG